MNKDEFRAILYKLGVSQHKLARALGISPRSVEYYLSGERAISGSVCQLMKLLDKRPLLLALLLRLNRS